ncbi:MAG: hypothetical protein F6J93_22130 [Oscillatoria sp. SIO1A7]|nr:hypothetical protein [Oscillatoria sp. SIO1A7]
MAFALIYTNGRCRGDSIPETTFALFAKINVLECFALLCLKEVTALMGIKLQKKL